MKAGKTLKYLTIKKASGKPKSINQIYICTVFINIDTCGL